MRLGLATSFWKRWDLSLAFLDYWTAFTLPGVEIVRAASYSYDGHDYRGALDARGWRSVQAPNKPLGRKLNRALPLLDDCDAVIAMGSDDFASRGWVRYAVQRMEHTQMVGTSSAYFYSPALDRLVYLKGSKMGACRMYHGEILRAVNWSLWNEGKSRALDASAQQRINWAIPNWSRFEWVNDIRAKNAFIMDVKVGDPGQKNDNVWGFSEIMTVHGDNYDCDTELMERYLGHETARRIRECR